MAEAKKTAAKKAAAKKVEAPEPVEAAPVEVSPATAPSFHGKEYTVDPDKGYRVKK